MNTLYLHETKEFTLQARSMGAEEAKEIKEVFRLPADEKIVVDLDIRVEKHLRRQGIASAMLRAFLEHAQRMHWYVRANAYPYEAAHETQEWVNTMKWLVPFYEKFGFRTCALQPGEHGAVFDATVSVDLIWSPKTEAQVKKSAEATIARFLADNPKGIIEISSDAEGNSINRVHRTVKEIHPSRNVPTLVLYPS